MKMSGLLSRRTHDLPGVHGVIRRVDPSAPLPRKLGAKDVVVIDLNRTDPATARALVEARVAAVIHQPHADEQMLPRTAYRVLAGSTVPVLQDVPVASLTDLGDGTRVRVDGGVLYRDDKSGSEVASGRQVDSAELIEQVDAAEATFVDSTLAHLANATEFLSLEHSLLLDGEGIPEIEGLRFTGRHVVVVTGEVDSAEQLQKLKPFIKEYRPILVGVDGGADLLVEAKMTPDLVVAVPTTVSDTVLVDTARLVVPADRDGRCEGLERVRELGIGATTFPAAATPRDMALLIAHHSGADMIVVTGDDSGLEGAFTDSAAPSSTMVDRALASKLVHANACASLYRTRGSGVGIALLVLAALVAIAAVVIARGAAQDFLLWAVETWNSFALWVQGLFR